MMCASTVQVSALPGEVVSNTGIQQKCFGTVPARKLDDFSKQGTVQNKTLIAEKWESPAFLFGVRVLATSQYTNRGLSFLCYQKHKTV